MPFLNAEAIRKLEEEGRIKGMHAAVGICRKLGKQYGKAFNALAISESFAKAIETQINIRKSKRGK